MKTEFKIAKNVPIPDPRSGGHGKSKLPFADMKKGDSFIFDKYSQYAMARASQYASYYVKSRNPKWKFCTRKTEDGMIRVWRIK